MEPFSWLIIDENEFAILARQEENIISLFEYFILHNFTAYDQNEVIIFKYVFFKYYFLILKNIAWLLIYVKKILCSLSFFLVFYYIFFSF